MKAFDSRPWRSVERPGYLGAKRDETHGLWDLKYGEHKWRLAWKFNDNFYDRRGMEMLYEDAYFNFLKNSSEVLEELVREASEVYDDAVSNINSGFDYQNQETNRTHVQDIAIRRCLVRLGRVFKGEHPIQLRDWKSEHPLGLTLSPGQVPFHYPELIETPELEGWWQPGSVESFYQSNKYLQVLKSRP